MRTYNLIIIVVMRKQGNRLRRTCPETFNTEFKPFNERITATFIKIVFVYLLRQL